MNDQLRAIVDHFAVEGRFVEAEAFGAGHVHETYRVLYESPERRWTYLLQKINPKNVPQADVVMANVQRVTEHLQQAADRVAVRLVPTLDGRVFWMDPQGQAWRVMPFIEGSETVESPENLTRVERAGEAFGRFLADTHDLDPAVLREVTHEYHSGPRTLEAFRKAVRQDSCYRRTQAQHEIEAVETHADLLDWSGPAPPIRVIHGDARLNNVLFEQQTGRPLCVIDLDTVTPGWAGHDFGDLVRSLASDAEEDEADLSQVTVDVERLRAVTRGFVRAAGDTLTPVERQSLPWALAAMPMLAAVRYLTDFLQGDLRFKTHKIRHNLLRCRVQLKLVEQLRQQQAAVAESLG